MIPYQFFHPWEVVDLNRYSRNISTLSQEENQVLLQSKVCVIGCGGLGGYTIEMLGRLGIRTITAVDGDVFDETNLNRQILSDEHKIGQSKAIAAQKRMAVVNSDVKVIPIVEFLNESNAQSIISGHQVIVDALDNIPTRFILQEACHSLQLPLVYGAIAGWYGQASTIFPNDKTLNKIYRINTSNGKEKELGNPAFTPALISSIQVSEVVKILINRGDLLRNKLLFINMLDHEYDVIDL